MLTVTECMNTFARRFAALGPDLAPRVAVAYFRSLPIEIRAALALAMKNDAKATRRCRARKAKKS